MTNCTYMAERKRKYDENSSLMKMNITNLLNPEPLPRCNSKLNKTAIDFEYYEWKSHGDELPFTKRRKSFEHQSKQAAITSFVDELASACELLARFQNDDCSHLNSSPPPEQKKSIPISGFFENQWNIRFSELIKFKEQYGHTNVTRAAEHKVLGNWVAEQRRKWKKGKLPSKQQRLLEDIGFEWDRSYYFLPNHSPADDRDSSSSSS